ncbi:hypothetical protein [Bartonella schoenbuchensis]|uniref:hypothetical protein n=1 Tax=Bartonella schoenbuchensis TaxID=165694 RepID=UPI00039A0B19|nr:hypothetical protein [Bartonella schoenbuchensis]
MPTGLPGFGSGYVATTTSRGLAMSWVNGNLGKNGYVYHIKATPYLLMLMHR